mgnify:CR=1 FL=1
MPGGVPDGELPPDGDPVPDGEPLIDDDGDAAGRADVGDFVVHDDRAERRIVEALAADENGGAGKRVLGKHRGEIRRRLIERDERERHLRGLRRLARDEVEAGRADAESRGQRGLRREPRTVGGAIRKCEICAGHGQAVGAPWRGVKKIFRAIRGAPEDAAHT